MTTPRRSWFRYSRRTLFVVVTALAAWLGYELNTVNRRAELKRNFVAQRGQCVEGIGWGIYRRWDDPPIIPVWRLWMADQPIGWFTCFEDEPAAAIANDVRRSFPEAHVLVFPADLR